MQSHPYRRCPNARSLKGRNTTVPRASSSFCPPERDGQKRRRREKEKEKEEKRKKQEKKEKGKKREEWRARHVEDDEAVGLSLLGFLQSVDDLELCRGGDHGEVYCRGDERDSSC